MRSASPAPFAPVEFHFQPGHAVPVVGYGSPEEHHAIAKPIRKAVAPCSNG